MEGLRASVEELKFDDVAINGTPSYRRLTLHNTSAAEVTLSILSSSPCVTFQHHNENFAVQPPKSGGGGVVEEAVGMYMALFDAVNVLTTVTLPPQSSVDLVASFTVDPAMAAHTAPQTPIPVSGTVVFAPADATGTREGSAAEAAGQVPPGDGVLVSFSATVFLAVITVMPAELRTTVAGGRAQLVDFSVMNASARPVTLIIRMQTMPLRNVDIVLYEQEMLEEPRFGQRLTLDAFASKAFSLMVRASGNVASTAQCRTTLLCDNLHDSRHSITVPVAISVVTEAQTDLVSIAESTLDFGDVYRGTRALRELCVTNLTPKEEVTLRIGETQGSQREGGISFVVGDVLVDEFAIAPQKLAQVMVVYEPTARKEQRPMSRMNFDVELVAVGTSRAESAQPRQQRVVLRCAAVLYTSTITTSQSNINFGDCQVGQSKRYTIHIQNHSPLQGKIVVQLRSKIISIEGLPSRASGTRETNEEFSIAPAGELAVTLKITPKRVNATYRKQLTIINVASSIEDRLIINIEANNMAPPEAKLHNELYTWSCRLPHDVPLRAITGVPLLVPYVASSNVAYPIVLTIASTSAEIETLLLDPAANIAEFEALAMELNSFAEFGETTFVATAERVGKVREELLACLATHTVAVTTLELQPLERRGVYVQIRRQGSMVDAVTKEDGLSIGVTGIEIPRFVRLSYRLCGSHFTLNGQKTKNFGEINIGEKKTTKLSISNTCRSQLFLRMSKSRLVTAGHIRIENSDRQTIFCSIRPFATKEVELVFHPGIKGVFEEKVRVTNILDPSNEATVTIKAVVMKADTFDVSPDTWSFGYVDISGEPARIGARFTVTNTSKTRRDVKMKLDHIVGAADKFFKFDGVAVRMHIEMEHSGSSSGSTRKIDEQIEKLEQKLKIYARKQKTEKVKAVQQRIVALKKALLGEEVDLTAAEDPDFSESEDESAGMKNRLGHGELLPMLLRDGVTLPSMAVGESVNIVFALTCSRVAEENPPAEQTSSVSLVIFEARDQEVNRVVPIDLTLVYRRGDVATAGTALGETVSASSSTSFGGKSTGAAASAVGFVGAATKLPAASASNVSAMQKQPGEKGGDAAASRGSLIVLEVDPLLPAASFMGHPMTLLANSVVGDWSRFTFVVRSSMETAVVVLEPTRCGSGAVEAGDMVDARFRISPRSGVVSQQEPLEITVECLPRSVGPQRYFIPVKNLKNVSDARFIALELNPAEEAELVVAEPKTLHFGDLVTPCRATDVEPQSILIRIRSKTPYALLIRSNTPSQVLLFEDAACTSPWTNPGLRTYSKDAIRIYCKYVPSSKALHRAARSVTSGVLIEAIVPSGSAFAVVGSTTVAVHARVGSGLVRCVGSPILDLGTIPPTEKTAAVTTAIRNPSDTFAVRVKLVSHSPYVGMNWTEGVIPPMKERPLCITARLNAPGLLKDTVTVHNQSCAQEPLKISITVLKLDDMIFADPHATVVFPVAAVGRVDGELRIVSEVTGSMVVTNHSTKDLILVSKSTLPLLFGAKDELLSPVQPFSHAGGRVLLEATSSQAIPWTLCDMPTLSEAELRVVANHGLVTVHGTAQVSVVQIVEETAAMHSFFRSRKRLPVVGQCVLRPHFQLTLAMSEGRVTPETIDLGLLGRNQADGYSHPFSLRILNLSPYLPLTMRVECEPLVRLSSTRILVHPGQTVTVEGSLTLSSIRTQGPFRYSIFFVNEQNPENDIAVSITGQYYLRVFQLLQDRGASPAEEVRESMTMAPLSVNAAASGVASVLSETKLSVAVTEQDVTLSVLPIVSPKFSNLLRLHVLQYDATAPADTLKFEGSSKTALLRLRCVLETHDLSVVSAAFFGSNKRNLAQLTFDSLGEVEKRRSNASQSLWIGTVRVSNPYTEDEEVQVFSSLKPFMTFKCASKLTVRPMAHTQESRQLRRLMGTMAVENVCELSAAQITVQPLVSPQCQSAITVSIAPYLSEFSGMGEVASNPSGPLTSGSLEDAAVEPVAGMKPGRGDGGGGRPPPTQVPVRGEVGAATVRIGPQSTATFSVTVTAAVGSEGSIEQSTALVVLDENVTGSMSVVRLGVAPAEQLEGDDEVNHQPSHGRSLRITPLLGGEVVVAQAVASPSTMLELRNCSPVPGTPGSYYHSFSLAKDDVVFSDIRIANSSSEREVEYTVVILSQSPQPWVTVQGTTGKLGPAEQQPLRMSTVAAEVGSYVSYLAIQSKANVEEVILLRLNGEIYVPSGDSLYDVTLNGIRVPASAPRVVNLGALYGAQSEKALTCLEIANRTTTPLEFPIIVVRPFRVRYHSCLGEDSSGSFVASAPANAVASGGAASTAPTFHYSTATHSSTDPRGGGLLPGSGGDGIGAASGPGGSEGGQSASATGAGPPDELLADASLRVYPFYGGRSRESQKYFVVEPKTRMKLAILVVCEREKLPEGVWMSFEAEVVFKSKQVRDAQHSFVIHFEVYRPTFRVPITHLLSETDGYVARVAIASLSSLPQSLAFRTQSPVLECKHANKADPITVGPNGAVVINVRLDVQRVMAMLGLPNDARLPLLNEHAFLLNADNPRESVRLSFVHGSLSGSMEKPLKVSGHYFGENAVLRFTQRFIAVLTTSQPLLSGIAEEGIAAMTQSTELFSAQHPTIPSTIRREELVRLLSQLRELHLELRWIVDELTFYILLLQNSRTLIGFGRLIASTVLHHPAIRLWRQHRAVLPGELGLLGLLADSVEFLPGPSSSNS